jgi:hypothetical protein
VAYSCQQTVRPFQPPVLHTHMQVCYAISQLAAGFEEQGGTSPMSPYFKDIVQALLETVSGAGRYYEQYISVLTGTGHATVPAATGIRAAVRVRLPCAHASPAHHFLFPPSPPPVLHYTQLSQPANWSV